MINNLFAGTKGPPDAPIVVVGEAYGFEEAQRGIPFCGASGHELDRMLAEAGVNSNDVLFTNVAQLRPQNNEMWRLFHPRDKPSGNPLIGGLDPTRELCAEIERLEQQLAASPRKLVVAAGNYPLWALTREAGTSILRASNGRPIAKEDQRVVPSGIMSWRGSMWHRALRVRDGYTSEKLLPIIHPAAILRQWSLRGPTVHDLRSRVRMALRNDWRHPVHPTFLAPPTFKECVDTLRMWLARADAGAATLLSEDIETARGFITCLGFADSPQFAMSIPFIRIEADRSFSSWWSESEEAIIIGLIHRVNAHPKIKVIGQNFIYDTQYIEHWLAATPSLFWDTMLAQNVLFPGTPKGLDYLSSLYCKYHWYWKEDHKEWDLRGRIEDLLVYNCWDNVRTFEVASAQLDVIEQSGLKEQMKLKMRTAELCLRMMRRGIRVDLPKRGKVSFELESASYELAKELEEIIPQDWVSPGNQTPWYRSDTQTRYLFYDRLGFQVQKDRKTGSPSVGKEARKQLEKKYPEFAGLFNRLRLYGSVENSHNVVNAGLDSDSRLRCSYSPSAETHRLISSKTPFGRGMNLQNLTKGEEDD